VAVIDQDRAPSPGAGVAAAGAVGVDIYVLHMGSSVEW
jgi:hypothetical protein